MNETRDQGEPLRMQRPQAIPMELCVSGGAVNVEIPKRKSRKHSGELGQRALRGITVAGGCSAREVGRALLAKTSRFLAPNCECAAR